MIAKQPAAGGAVVVYFPGASCPADCGGDRRLQDWGASPIWFSNDGPDRVAVAKVAAGRRYAFRYTTVSGGECNDDAADDYQPDLLGTYAGIIDLTRVDYPAFVPER